MSRSLLFFLDKVLKRGLPLSVSSTVAMEERLLVKKAESIPGVHFTTAERRTLARSLIMLKSGKVHSTSESNITGSFFVESLSSHEKDQADLLAAASWNDRCKMEGGSIDTELAEIQKDTAEDTAVEEIDAECGRLKSLDDVRQIVAAAAAA